MGGRDDDNKFQNSEQEHLKQIPMFCSNRSNFMTNVNWLRFPEVTYGYVT